MKKFLVKLTALTLFVGVLASCDEDKVIYHGQDEAIAAFRAASSTLPVTEAGTSSIIVMVDVSEASDADRTIAVSIDPASTALPAQYSISDLVIPAGEFNGEVKITGNFDALVSGEVVKLILNLDSVGDATLNGLKRHELLIFQSCPVVRDEFIGTYDGEETPGPYNYINVVTAGAAANELVITNVWEAGDDTATHIFLSNDPLNTTVTFPPFADNYLADIGTYGPGYIDPTGTPASSVDPCFKIITLNFKVRVSAGTFPASKLVMTKQ